ncbi:MAG: SBBP repeat-containing protein [bacterium]
MRILVHITTILSICFCLLLTTPALSGILNYSTYLCNRDYNEGYGIAVDGGGNAYITGFTSSAYFPTTIGSLDTIYNGSNDVFISKLNSSGTALVYSTYLGGKSYDEGWSIAIDGAENAYITGKTYSDDFPVTETAFDTTMNGGYDSFVSKLNAAGNALIYSTYLGGNDYDWGRGIALDKAGNAYITGYTCSSTFPTTNTAIDNTWNGKYDVFVSKLNSSGTALLYSTYLGGLNDDCGRSIAVDSSGNAYITGYTFSPKFPVTAKSLNSNYNGNNDAFVSKLNPTGTKLLYSTYLGGISYDEGWGIAVDKSGNAYITGKTASADFPIAGNAIDSTWNGGYDVFISKLNPAGNALVYSTFLGGSNDDWGRAIAIDKSENVFLTGYTWSIDFPLTAGAIDSTQNKGYDLFVSKLSANGSVLIYSTYFGGKNDDCGYAIAIDSASNAYITGKTDSPDFPVTAGAVCSKGNGDNVVFVSKFALGNIAPPATVNINSFGEFNTNTDIVNWYFERYGDGTDSGTITWIPEYNKQSGVMRMTQRPGDKGKLTQIFTVPIPGWYTAKAKVATDIADANRQQKVYLYFQEYSQNMVLAAVANQVISAGSGSLLSMGLWKQLQISFYTSSTIVGIQVVGINNSSSGTIGSLYIDDILVYPVPADFDKPLGKLTIPITNSEFDSNISEWLVQTYADGNNPGVWSWLNQAAGRNGIIQCNQAGGEKGKVSQLFNLPNAGKNTITKIWVFSDARSKEYAQKVYLYLYSYDSTYRKIIESGNAILQGGQWTPGEWRELKLGCIPFTTYNSAQFVSINPAGNPSASIYFDDITVLQE